MWMWSLLRSEVGEHCETRVVWYAWCAGRGASLRGREGDGGGGR
jgi:hypothetical protein